MLNVKFHRLLTCSIVLWKRMSCRLHFIHISFLITHSVRVQTRQPGRKEGRRKQARKSVFYRLRCLDLFLSNKCSDMGRKVGNNERRSPFQDSCIVLIVQTRQRKEKKVVCFLRANAKKRTNLAFFPAMCWSNYVQTL